METPPDYTKSAYKVKEENEYCTIDDVKLTVEVPDPATQKE